jgi:hypothetical protein
MEEDTPHRSRGRSRSPDLSPDLSLSLSLSLPPSLSLPLSLSLSPSPSLSLSPSPSPSRSTDTHALFLSGPSIWISFFLFFSFFSFFSLRFPFFFNHSCLSFSPLSGIIAIGYVPTSSSPKRTAYSRLHQYSKLYLFSPSAALVTCPLAMTDGACRLLEQVRREREREMERWKERVCGGGREGGGQSKRVRGRA